MRTNIISLSLIATIAVAIPIASMAAGSGAPPLLVPYSGVLELNGTPATGTFEMHCRLFDGDETDGSATQLWDAERDVEVASGQFSLTLGTSAAIPVAAAHAQGLFVEVEVEGTPLGRRQRVTPSIQAVRAATATTFDVTGRLTAASIAAATSVSANALSAATVDATNIEATTVDATNHVGDNVSVSNVTQSGAEAGFNFTGDHTSSQYVRIGELQIAWGDLQQTYTANSTTTINFPAPFSSVPTVNVSVRDPGFGSSSATSSAGARTIRTANFDALFKGAGGSNAIRWMAMGPWR